MKPAPPPAVHIEYELGTTKVHPCPHITRADLKHDEKCAKARRHGEPLPERKPTLRSDKLSEITCTGCIATLKKFPQLWNQLRNNDVAAGTAVPMAELEHRAKVAEIVRLEKLAERRERAKKNTAKKGKRAA